MKWLGREKSEGVARDEEPALTADDGQPGRPGNAATARMLGDADACPAKRWLARCLRVCLANHRDPYFGCPGGGR